MNEENKAIEESVETSTQEEVKEIVEKKSRVLDPRDPNEEPVEYDYKCGDCGSYNLTIEEEEKENGTIITSKKCKDCESANIIKGYSDVVIECNRCGKLTRIDHPGFTNVRGGINIPPLYTTNKHLLGLACSHCKNDEGKATSLTLRFKPAENPPADEVEEPVSEVKEEVKPKLEIVKD